MVSKISFNLMNALNFIHKANVIHRDIKPANIMIDEQLNLKIVDFGLARTAPVHSEQIRKSFPKTMVEKKELAQQLDAERSERVSRKRAISPHVQTRIYRAPEVVLLQNSYSFGVDVWSFGCILAELIQCQNIYVHDGHEAPYLFPSTSCTPLSPPSSGADEKDDYMRVMLNILGDQKDHDLSFLSKSKAKSFVKDHFSGAKKVKFNLEFPKTDPSICGLLTLALQFNPYFRPSAEDILECEEFDKLRQKSAQVLPSEQI